MDWVIGIFLLAGFLFFWAVWIFGYWLPMAKEAQRQFQEQEAREKAARQREQESAAGHLDRPTTAGERSAGDVSDDQ